MSQIYYEEVTLEQLARSANTILIVQQNVPAMRRVEIAIDQTTHDGQPAPPFAYHVQRFVVQEVLRGNEELRGVEIEVDPNDVRNAFESHVEYYVDGLSTSPIVACYSPQGNTEGESLIVFLHDQNGGFEFCMDGAIEGAEFTDAIRALNN